MAPLPCLAAILTSFVVFQFMLSFFAATRYLYNLCFSHMYNVLQSCDLLQFKKHTFRSTICFIPLKILGIRHRYTVILFTLDRWRDLHPESLINMPKITQSSFSNFSITKLCLSSPPPPRPNLCQFYEIN